jgi:predicted DsbA family dithiol-disulfide isomerase
VEWRGVEIHPETPPGGRLLAELFRARDINSMMEHLSRQGAAFGITFLDRPFLSNSHSALQAAEFAREHGRFEAFHPALFAAYFSHGLDIGNLDVLSHIAGEAGLNPVAMADAIHSGQYLLHLQEAREAAERHNVTSVPTFIINETHTIVGTQSLDVFRRALRSQ